MKLLTHQSGIPFVYRSNFQVAIYISIVVNAKRAKGPPREDLKQMKEDPNNPM
jgi:hypothetical protein